MYNGQCPKETIVTDLVVSLNTLGELFDLLVARVRRVLAFVTLLEGDLIVSPSVAQDRVVRDIHHKLPHAQVMDIDEPHLEVPLKDS